jgi:hypothetical protein
MPQYPLDPQKLLETAGRLVPATLRRGRPAYTDHRRGVSTAYYAVFHAITDRVVKAAFEEADADFQQKIQRWVGHGDIRAVSIWISQLEGTRPGGPPRHIANLLQPGSANHIDSETLRIADGFLELNEKREEADYDHGAVFTRADTLSQIALAGSVVEAVQTTQADAAKRYFGLIAMQANVKPR